MAIIQTKIKTTELNIYEVMVLKSQKSDAMMETQTMEMDVAPAV